MGGFKVLTFLGAICFIGILFQQPRENLSRKLRTVTEDQHFKIQTEMEIFMRRDFELARRESYDFFDNIRSTDWQMLKDRTKSNIMFLHPEHPVRLSMSEREIRVWYMENVEPQFTCPHERRIGTMNALGDGAKWICDAHRIGPQIRRRRESGGNGCLIYSVGSNGNFMFEQGIQNGIEGESCEIHIFDVIDYGSVAPPNVYFHHWGFKGSKDTNPNVYGELPLKSFQETVEILGHQGKVVDLFKIDCEGCEWNTYKDWLETPVILNQILVEVHGKPKADFFTSLKDAGYITFHKEANLAGTSQAVEYAFLKLDPLFFK